MSAEGARGKLPPTSRFFKIPRSGNWGKSELAWELGVTMRTIHHDIFVLSFDYPIYTKPGCCGGVFITENYKPYTNTLTETELETLCRLYGKSEGKEKEILFRIIRKYGADKL